MKKIVFVLPALFLCAAAGQAAPVNPMFGNNHHQLAFNFGYGVNSGFLIPPPTQFVPFIMLHFQYSQPTTFFKLPARQSINVVQTIGSGKKYGWNWDKYSIPIAWLSQDVALFHGRRWYFGPGIGVGMQGKENERIGSKLVFGFKIMGGYAITDSMRAELFVQHFSNGNTAPENNSYAFYGAGFSYSF